MKNVRHDKIIEIINKYPVETQEELAGYLNDAGFQVTQSTVSRDIKQLNLVKITSHENGKMRYALHGQPRQVEKYARVFKDGVVSMDMAMNILVIKTVSGMAMAVAAALDSMHLDPIVGTIAGDDTIMCAVRTIDDTRAVLNKLNKVLES